MSQVLQSVHVIGAPHPVADYPVLSHPLEAPLQLAIMEARAKANGATHLFMEGVSDRGKNAFYVAYVESKNRGLANLNSLIALAFSERKYSLWYQAMIIRSLLRLEEEGLHVELMAGEVDQQAANLMRGFFTGEPDFDLFLKFAQREGLDLDVFFSECALNPDALPDMVKKLRIKYGDKELARNIRQDGGINNLVLCGSAHLLEGWETQFNLWRADVINTEDESGALVVRGQQFAGSEEVFARFTSEHTGACIRTEWHL